MSILRPRAPQPVERPGGDCFDSSTARVPRCLPEGTRAVLESKRWPRPAVFDWLQRLGGVSDAEMDSTFNMGLGMVAVVPPAAVKPGLALLAARGVPAWEVGRIEASTGEPTTVVVR